MALRNLGLVIGLTAGLYAAGTQATMISAEDIVSGYGGGLTFEASGGALGLKTVNGVTAAGVGVAGNSSTNEINIGERLTASSSTGFVLESLALAFLYDGPEFGDVEEIARITANFMDGSSSTALIKNEYVSPEDDYLLLTIDGAASPLILGASTATFGSPGTVSLGAIFGRQLIASLTFDALRSDTCGTGRCTNQSDYSILNIISVPEPGSLMLMLLGLAGILRPALKIRKK